MEDLSLYVLVGLDFIPNFAFLIGFVWLSRTGALLCGDDVERTTLLGGLLVFLGGFLQAVWKLIFTLDGGDYHWMSDSQFVLMAPGFTMLMVAARQMVRLSKQLPTNQFAAMALWKAPFLTVMTITSLLFQAQLVFLALRRGQMFTGLCFAVSLICLLAMGGMAGQEQTINQQWLEEIVNTLGQLGFMLGSILIYRHFRAMSKVPGWVGSGG